MESSVHICVVKRGEETCEHSVLRARRDPDNCDWPSLLVPKAPGLRVIGNLMNILFMTLKCLLLAAISVP